MIEKQIKELKPNQIFVFGSNLAGRHGRGAALQANREFGAVYGIGEGLTGRCYALPTLDFYLKKRSGVELAESARRFLKCAREMPDTEFLLTKVGCGLAGYSEEMMKEMFVDAPPNVVKPEGW